MPKPIYPLKIVDGFTHPHGNLGYQLIKNEQDTPNHVYARYELLIYMQNEWDKKIILQNNFNEIQNNTYHQLKSGNKYLKNFFKNIICTSHFSFATKLLLDNDYIIWHQYIDAYQQTLNARRQVLSNKNFEKSKKYFENDQGEKVGSWVLPSEVAASGGETTFNTCNNGAAVMHANAALKHYKQTFRYQVRRSIYFFFSVL